LCFENRKLKDEEVFDTFYGSLSNGVEG